MRTRGWLRGSVGVLVTVVLSVLGGAAAQAAFNPTEDAAVRKIFDANASLYSGIGGALGFVLRGYDASGKAIVGTNATTRNPIQQVWILTTRAQNDMAFALADLLGADVAPLGQSRDYYVSRAKGKIQTTVDITLPQLAAAIDKAKGAGANAYYLDRLKIINVANAITYLRAFLTAKDTTGKPLAYLDPYPPGRSPAGRITIVGPHGEYPKAETWLITALERINRAYQSTLAAYGADSLLSNYENVYQTLKFYSLAQIQNLYAMGTAEGMQFSGDTPNAFFRILNRLETLTHGGGGPTTPANDCSPDRCHGTPYDYDNMMSFILADQAAWNGRPTFMVKSLEAIKNIGVAWSATDTAVWYHLKFPECDQATQPEGCGGTGQ